MEQRKKNYCKWGVGFAIGWIALTLGIYTLTCLVEGVPFTENMEADNWTAFYVCYAITVLACFYIGYGLRKEYRTKEEAVVASSEDPIKASERFRLRFIRRYSRMMVLVFVLGIAQRLLFNVHGELRTKDAILVGVLMVASLVCAYLNRRITRKLKE